MLKIAIETGYSTVFKSKDLYGSRYYMQKMFEKNGIELVRVSIKKYNTKKKSFGEYNIFTADGKITTIKKEYIPDIIRNRIGSGTAYKHHILPNMTIIPSQKINTIANDKYETYMFFQKYQPTTFLLNNVFKNRKIQQQNTGQMIIKPIRSNGGKGIKKVSIQELLEEKELYKGLEELYIVQEFKDFSGGCPGIAAGSHDIRLMFAGKEIIETTLRTPPTSGFRSNIGSGGSQTTIDPKALPKKLIALGKKIYKEICPEQKEIISIDCAFSKAENKRYLIEINASPGTRYYQQDKKILEKICKGLVKFFKNI